MPHPILTKLFGRSESRPDQALSKRLEKLLKNIEKPRIAHPSKLWYAKEVQKAVSPLLITIPFEKPGEFAIVWAQNRIPYGLMLFAQSNWPNIDYDLWAYTREKYRGHSIAKQTLSEGIRQLAIDGKEAVLTAEILIEDERTRQSSVRWLKVLGFIASETDSQSNYKSLYMAAYTQEVLQKALNSLPTEFQKKEKKMPPMPPDILTKFTDQLTESFDQGGSDLLARRRSL